MHGSRKSSEVHDGKSLKCLEQNARNVKVKSAFGEVSGGNEEHVIGNWRQDGPCYKAVEDLAELYSVQWKVELIANEPEYLVEEIAKQSAEGPP